MPHSRRRSKDERAVVAGKAERVAEDALYGARHVGQGYMAAELRIALGAVQGRRNKPVLDGHHRKDPFDDARRSLGVSHPALGGTAQGLAAEHTQDGSVFRSVIRRRSGAVEVYVVDVTGR